MANWQSEWFPPCSHPNNQPIVWLVWMNWDDDDDGRFHTTWWSYVVLPVVRVDRLEQRIEKLEQRQ